MAGKERIKAKDLLVTGITVAIGQSALKEIVPEGLAGAGMEIGGAFLADKQIHGDARGVVYGLGILGIVNAFEAIIGVGGLTHGIVSAVGEVI